jgi:hypothetical protein
MFKFLDRIPLWVYLIIFLITIFLIFVIGYSTSPFREYYYEESPQDFHYPQQPNYVGPRRRNVNVNDSN